MRRIWIDFGQPVAPARQMLRMALLLLGMLALAYALFRQHQISAEQTALAWQQQNLARLETRQLPILHTALTSDVAQEANKRANEVLRQLNLPWDRLFATLERAVAPGINVLAVEPDPHKASITLKASAPDANAALDFIERLQSGSVLSGVHLVNQEIMADAKHQPLVFIVNAEWKTKP